METREGSGFTGVSLHLDSVFLSPSPCHSRSLFPHLFVSASLTLLSPSSPIFLLTSHQCPHPPPHPSPFEARASQEGLAGAGARGHLAETRLRGLALPRPSSSAIPEDLRGPGLSPWARNPDRLCWSPVTLFLPQLSGVWLNGHCLAWE